MTGKKGPAIAYALLFIGAATAAALFARALSAGEGETPVTRIVWLYLWILAPYALVAMNIFVLKRFVAKSGIDGTLLGGAVVFVAMGAFVYGRVLLVPSGQQMESYFVFIFGPRLHFGVAVLVTIVYFVRGFFQLMSKKREE